MCKDINEELIKEVQALAKKLGRTPKRREFENHPSACWHFGSWNNFVKEAGLLPLKELNLTLKDYGNIIHEFVEKEGRTPTMRDFDRDEYLPDSTTITKQFKKSWSEVLVQLGYEANIQINDFSDFTDEELLKIVRKELEKIGATTIVSYRDNRRKNAPSVGYLNDRLGLKWNEILKKIDMPINVEIRTKREWLQILRDLAKELGKTPSISNLRDNGYDYKVFQMHFGSWNNAIRLAGLKPNSGKVKVTHTDKELLNMYIELCKKLKRAATSREINEFLPYSSDVYAIRFGGIDSLKKLAGYEPHDINKKYTKKEIKNKLLEEYNKINRTLTNKELSNLSKQNEKFPSITTICRHFKTTKMSEVWGKIID